MGVDSVEFLEHFGVKGQRWGVRKEPASFGPGRSNKARKKAAKKIAIGVVGGAALAAGAIYTAKRMGMVGSTPMKTVHQSSGPSKQNRDLINQLMAKHDEQVRLFDSDLRKRAQATGTHYISNHVPWVPI